MDAILNMFYQSGTFFLKFISINHITSLSFVRNSFRFNELQYKSYITMPVLNNIRALPFNNMENNELQRNIIMISYPLITKLTKTDMITVPWQMLIQIYIYILTQIKLYVQEYNEKEVNDTNVLPFHNEGNVQYPKKLP